MYSLYYTIFCVCVLAELILVSNSYGWGPPGGAGGENPGGENPG